MIYIVGFVIGSFLFFLSVLKNKKNLSDWILMIWMGVLSIHLFLHYMQWSGLSYQYPHTLGLALGMPLLHGIFLYFYTIEITKGAIINPSRMLLHLLPFISLNLLAIPFFRLPGLEKLKIFKNEGAGFEWFQVIQVVFILVSGFLYATLSLYEIRKYRKRIKDFFSNTDRMMLKWLECLAIGLGLIWCMVIFFEDQYIFAGVALFVLFIGFFGINQVPIFNSYQPDGIAIPQFKGETPVETLIDTQSKGKLSKYAKSGMTDTEAFQVMEQVESLMQKDKLYLECNLTLNDLAARIFVSPNQLSQSINSITGKTFYEYINTLRIEEFLAMASLPENRKYTFLSLANDCGFNSKTTFNKYFKMHTGQTPTDYFGTTLP